jgi:tRNA G18 (ribose-2'-O)-methylase SpoU
MTLFPPGGWFGVGIWKAKTEANLGTLWRSAWQMGASMIFTIGHRYKRQASDVVGAWKRVPFFQYADWQAFEVGRPFSCPLVGVEMGGEPLAGFTHPPHALYLLGAEDHGLAPEVLTRCTHRISIESVRYESYNVAVAVSLVLYSRMLQLS